MTNKLSSKANPKTYKYNFFESEAKYLKQFSKEYGKACYLGFFITQL